MPSRTCFASSPLFHRKAVDGHMVHPGIQQPFQGIPDGFHRLAGIAVDQVSADPPEACLPGQGNGFFRLFRRMDPAHGGQFSRLEGLDAQAQPVEAQLPVKPESFPVHRPRIGFQGASTGCCQKPRSFRR